MAFKLKGLVNKSISRGKSIDLDIKSHFSQPIASLIFSIEEKNK